MKTVLNHIRRLNISNSVIEASTGFSKTQLKAYIKNPLKYPVMDNKLKEFYKLHSNKDKAFNSEALPYYY